MKKLYIFFIILIFVGCSPKIEPPQNVFEAVDRNDASFVMQYLSSGGNPNIMDEQGRSLLYIATGPHGGMEVLTILLEYKALPDKGMGKYTPLMNAASWVWLDGVKKLVAAGANPLLTNSKGQTALQCVGNAGGKEKTVIKYLKTVIVSNKANSNDAKSGAAD